MFKIIKNVPIDQLLLDPSNPRFAEGFSLKEEHEDLEGVQEQVIRHFENRDTDTGDEDFGSGSEEEKYGVNNLITSIRTIGFVPVDKPVVKRVKGSKKLLVIEGNRRATACKIIIRKHKEQADKGLKPDPERDYPLPESILETIQCIDVLEIKSDGLTEEELKRQERVVLGVRHHGSLVEWEPLPKAYSIFKEYMEMDPPLQDFKWNNKRANHVRDVFTLGKQSPRKALKSYAAYRKLRDSGISIQPHHFSLVQELVSSAKLTTTQGYIAIDPNSFELSEDSITKLDLLCQFATRDQSKQTKSDFKILRDPKSVKQLAKLVDACRNSDQAVAQFAVSLLQEVESGERPLEAIEGHSLQAAADALLEFMNRRKWVDELERLLARLDGDDKLALEDFGATNDLIRLEELDKQLEVFRLVFQLK